MTIPEGQNWPRVKMENIDRKRKEAPVHDRKCCNGRNELQHWKSILNQVNRWHCICSHGWNQLSNLISQGHVLVLYWRCNLVHCSLNAYSTPLFLSRTTVQWNLSVTTTSFIRFITCNLFSNVFYWRLKVPIYSCEQFMPPGAHLGGPRWAPKCREVSHWVVVIDRFHCTYCMLWLGCVFCWQGNA